MPTDEALRTLETERRGTAAWLWLNRPQVRNALNAELQRALAAELKRTEKDASVRSVVIAGRGPAFSAGGDLSRMERAAALTKARARAEAERFAGLLLAMQAFPKPIVARVHGAAFAGGMGLAAACDLVVAADEAEFCLPEVRIGLVPAMISPYLVRAIGAQQARRYVLTGERLPAREAQRLGLVHECVPAAELDARVEALCARLAQAGPQALARAKRLLRRVETRPLSPGLARETAGVLADVRSGDEAREGMRAFLEKRRPPWST